MPADQLYHHSPALDAHNKDQPKNKVDLLMVTTTGLPRDLAEFVDFSMMTQAKGLQFGIAHFRRRTPHCSGAMIWQLDDCWPGQSWSVIDYYGFPKAGYYAVRRAYAPVLASFQALPDGAVAVWLTNDTRAPVTDTLLLEYGDFATGAHWREAWPIAAAPGRNAPVARLAAARIPPGPNSYLALRAAGDSFPGTRHFFVPLKDLQRTPAPPTVTLTPDGAHALRVTIRRRAISATCTCSRPTRRRASATTTSTCYPASRARSGSRTPPRRRRRRRSRWRGGSGAGCRPRISMYGRGVGSTVAGRAAGRGCPAPKGAGNNNEARLRGLRRRNVLGAAWIWAVGGALRRATLGRFTSPVTIRPPL